ncbi:hypothetical protein ATK78_3273 [Pedobacter metabolipauper]|uniref:Uncharacterized protein n=1 Tax=Pedobacter metabolipauper TaxID=425513 RepID=A0A4R6STH7_9SPHI|nr:hypothetical protein ATK78_3273 [Pedobacter metabolipauper]
MGTHNTSGLGWAREGVGQGLLILRILYCFCLGIVLLCYCFSNRKQVLKPYLIQITSVFVYTPDASLISPGKGQPSIHNLII